MNQIARRAALVLTVGLAVLGCGQGDEPVGRPTAAATASAASSPVVPPSLPSAESPDVAEAAAAKALDVEFTPPFPQREELFQPPQRALNAARREDEHGETVELKGFIHVEEPRVVLSIDGVVSSVPAGGEKYGVQVIAIDPPTAILQRGGRRWPATLE